MAGAISQIFSVVPANFAILFVPTPQVQAVNFYFGPEWIGQQSGPAQIIAFPATETMVGPQQQTNPPTQPGQSPRQLRRALTRILWMIWAPFPPLPNWACNTVLTASPAVVGIPSIMQQNGFYFTVTTGGITGAVEPVWPTTVGATVTDNTVVWTCTGTTAAYSALKTDNVEVIRAALVQSIHAATVGSYKLLTGEWYRKSDQFAMAGLSYILTTEFNIPLIDYAEGTAVVTSTPLTSIVLAD